MPKKKPKPAKKPNGRPSKFDEAYVEQAYKLALLGSTDKQLADFWGISEATLNSWKHIHSKFLESLKAGKLIADGNVTQSLYRRANGYSHEAVKILQYEGAPVIVPYTEHYPPDTTACIFWLKNRQPAMWRDKIDTTTQLLDDKNNPVDSREIARRLAFLLTAGVQQPEETKPLH